MADIPWSRLHHVAKQAASRAYAPYSRFSVGAAVWTVEGRLFSAANVENASYGLTLCAERNAIFTAVSARALQIEAVAIFTPTAEPTAPCGACRQVIREFGPLAQIRSFSNGPLPACWTLPELLPDSFGPDHLGLVATVAAAQAAAPDPIFPKPILCIDIDNVLADSDPVMRALIEEVTRGRVRLRREDVRVFDYRDCVDPSGEKITKQEWDEVHHRRFSTKDVLIRIPAIPGAQPAIAALGERYALHFVTSRTLSARAATADWLIAQGFVDPQSKSAAALHFVQSGEKHLVFAHAAAAIDDDADQVVRYVEGGCELSIAFAHPWNLRLEGDRRVERLPDWPAIVARLLQFVDAT